MKSFLLVSLWALVMVPSWATAQGVVVTGVVRTASGAPVPYARVRSPHASLEALTDSTGAFRVLVAGSPGPDRAIRLQAERIGYLPSVVTAALVTSVVSVDIVMAALPAKLDEVIISGTAGTLTRRAQASVVTSVNVGDLTRLFALSTVADVLQGRVTSLDLTPSDGSVGESQRLWLRGGTSIAVSNEPLMFLDGVRIDSRSQRANTNVGGQASSRLFDIDPADIERIEIVKGPAAATLYGADAATGVIQIFTKRASSADGVVSQDLSAEFGVIDAMWNPPPNYARCAAPDILPGSSTLLCQGLAAGDMVTDNPLARAHVPGTGHTSAVRWAASRGGRDFRASTSINLEQQDGTLPQNSFSRNTFRLAALWDPAPSFRLDGAIGLFATRTALPQNADNPQGILVNGLLGNPLTVGRPTGGWFSVSAEALATVEQVNNVLRALPTIQASHHIGSRFSHRLVLGMDATSSAASYFVPRRLDDALPSNFRSGVVQEEQVAHAARTLDYQASLTLRDPARSALGAMASVGTQYVQLDENKLFANGTGLVSNDARRVSDAADRRGGQTLFHTRSLGYFGQLELSHRDRTFVQLGARADYHSAFGSRASAPWFPRAGVSHVLVERSRGANDDAIIDRLRLRMALGTSGRAPPLGEGDPTYSAAPFMLDSVRFAQGVIPRSPGNPHLRPERSREFEAGVDAELLHDQVRIEATWFDKQSTDLLFRLPVPPSSGFVIAPLTNIGSVVNRGLEVTANATMSVGRGATLATYAGLTTLHNEVAELGDARAAAATNGVRQGSPLGAMFDHRVRFVDAASGHAIVSDSTEFAAPAMPTHSGFLGATLSLSSGLRFAVTFDGKSGYAMHNATSDFRDRQMQNSFRSVRRDELDADDRIRRFGPFETESGSVLSAASVLGPYLQDATFARWREASITWDLPSGWLRRIGARDGSMTIAGRNLMLWTGYEGDPEVVTYVSELSSGGSFQYEQLDFMSMPQPRRWLARVSLRY